MAGADGPADAAGVKEDEFVESRRAGLVVASGFSRDQLRASRFERRSHGLYRPAGARMDPDMERLADAVGLLTPGCCVGGWAALRAQGNTWFDGRDRDGGLRPALVHCLPGAQLRRRREDLIQPFRGLLHPDEQIDLDGWPVATMARAAFDEMRMAVNVREAVVALDMATSTTSDVPHTSPGAVRRVVESHHKIRGVVRAREALDLGDPRSASPWETRTRLIAQIDVGLAGLRVNVPVFAPAGSLLGVVDLLAEEEGLVIESDGGQHREIEQHADDNRREELLERAGLVVVRFTSRDHGDRLSIIRRINAARRDARQSRHRDWTTQAPSWWTGWSGASRYR